MDRGVQCDFLRPTPCSAHLGVWAESFSRISGKIHAGSERALARWK